MPNRPDAVASSGWRKIEVAKRRLVHELLDLGLPVMPKLQSPSGLIFDLLMPQDAASIIIGHANGVMTLNVKESESPFREEVRIRLGESYRTLRGHLRHELGHYHWDLLVATQRESLNAFRNVFGDERLNYDEAMANHYYMNGPHPDWTTRWVSAYA